ncbi:hypothetical protein FRC07_004356, partial [Ceratobasidium sp. 392]
MFMLENDSKHMEFEDASLMLAKELSLIDPIHGAEIEQWIFDCYQDLTMRQPDGASDYNRVDPNLRMASHLLLSTPVGSPNRPKLLELLGTSLQQRFAATSRVSSLNMAVNCYYQAVLLASLKNLDELVDGVLKLGNSCFTRFQVLGQVEDISQAITCYSCLVRQCSADVSTMRGLLQTLASFYAFRFDLTGQRNDIDQAIATQHLALTYFFDDDPQRTDCLSNLGFWYYQRYEYFDAPSDVEASIDIGTQAVSLSPDGHPDKPGRLCNLGTAYSRRYERLGDLKNLELAISIHRQAVSLCDQDDVCLPLCLDSLGNSLTRQFERSGRVTDIDEVIACHTQAVKLTPEEHPARRDRLNNLGNSYGRRFRRLGRLADLEQSIEYLQETVLLTPEEHMDYPERLENLGASVMHRFERLGDLNNLDRGISCFEEAISLTPPDHEKRRSRLMNLGPAIMKRYERLSHLEDLELTIRYLTEALSLTPDDHVTRPDQLAHLGLALQDRYELIGQVCDLDEALNLFAKANQSTPHGHADKAVRLQTLASAFFLRSRDSRQNPANINQAVIYYDQALALAPKDHPHFLGILSSYGDVLHERYQLQGNVADINQAIEYHRQAVSLIPQDYASCAAFYSGLGTALTDRFLGLDKVEDLEESVVCLTKAVDLTPEHHSGLPGRLFDLARCFMCQANVQQTPVDLNRALSCLEKALSLTPEGHPARVGVFNTLGSLTERRYHRYTADSEDLVRSISFYKSAALSTSGKALQLLRAAHSWARAVELLNGLPSFEAYGRAMELVPRVAWLGITVFERYEKIPAISEIVMKAVSAAIAHQKYTLALEWLEEGRCIVWNQITLLRTPADGLRQADPVLADELELVARKLDRAGTAKIERINAGPQHEQSLEEAAQLHRRLAEKWDELIARVRLIPEFQSFLLPKQISKLAHATRDRTIVVISVQKSRCDALALLPGSDQLTHTPLFGFSYEKAALALKQLASSLNSQGIRQRGVKVHKRKSVDRFESVLALLWIDVVKPVLDCLGYSKPGPTHELPHVTWCTTGPLAFLPLHAAGLYDVPHSRAFDFV